MPRVPTGTIYSSGGKWFAAFSLPKKTHFALATCRSREDADDRRSVLADIVARLKAAKKSVFAEGLCRAAAEADDRRLGEVLRLVEGVLAGEEEQATRFDPPATSHLTVAQFGRRWTSGQLHRDFPHKVKDIDQHDNAARLENWVYPVIGHVKLRDFTVDHADAVFRNPKLPAGSRRNVGLIIHRLVVLAVYPGRCLSVNPLPEGWIPAPNPRRAKNWVFPSEDAKLLARTSAPLVRRLLIGLINREGPRKEEAASIEWSDLALDGIDGGGMINLDENKTDDPRAWALDPGTAEALRRWRRICPSKRWVFPADGRRTRHVYVDHLASELREDLRAAGVDRPALFTESAKRIRLRAHDLRATFITVALANGRSEAWVQDRTGHTSSIMINTYRRQARTYADLGLGALKPLYEAIPELAEIESEAAGGADESTAESTGGVTLIKFG